MKNQDLHRRHTRTYNRFLDERQYTLLEAMENVIEQVFRRQSQAFKINMSFSYILQNRETGEYRFFYASNNEQLLNIPKLIHNQEDLNKLLNHLASKYYPTFLKQHRPNSKWTLERIVNLRVIVYHVDFPLGRPPKLPAYIKHNRFIIGLEKMQRIRNDTRTISASSAVWPLVNLVKLITIAAEKQKNCSRSIVIISKLMPNHFKAYVLKSSRSWNSISKFNCMPCQCRKMKQPRHSTCQHFLTLKKFT